MRKTSFAVPAAAAGLLLGITGAASAASIGVKDPADISHGVDLRAVQLKNGDNNVVVVTSHTNLRRDHRTGSGGSVFLDTDPADRGPEYVFVGGFFVGTDYQLLRTEGFGVEKWGSPVNGSYEMTVDYDRERVRFRISQKVLKDPDEIRVAVRVGGTRSDGTSDGLVDWLGEPRSFTDWVAKG